MLVEFCEWTVNCFKLVVSRFSNTDYKLCKRAMQWRTTPCLTGEGFLL